MPAQPEPTSRYDLSSYRFFAHPEHTFSRMREQAPVYFDPLLQSWVLTTYEDVSRVLRSQQFSVDRNGAIGRNGSPALVEKLESVNAIVREWMVFSDPPRHTRLRGAVAKAFQPRALQKLEPVIRRIVAQLLDATDRRNDLEVLSEVGEPLAERVTAHMLGLPPEDSPKLKSWTLDLFGLVGAAEAEDAVVEANARGIEAFRDYVSQILAARRQHPQNDLITEMLSDLGGEFSEEEIVGLVITLVAGAYETTAHAITNGTYCLLKHEREFAKLRRNPRLIVGAVEELFRFCGPALGVQRRALEDVEVGGRMIRARERVYCMLHAANHDPAEFEDPEVLDIRRAKCRHLGLGLGAHFCLGAWLTRMETQIAIGALAERFPGMRLASPDEPEWVANFAIRGMKELRVRKGSNSTTTPAPSHARLRIRRPGG